MQVGKPSFAVRRQRRHFRYVTLVSALVAIGGGAMTVPYLVWCNTPIRHAIGTASAVGFPIALEPLFYDLGPGDDRAAIDRALLERVDCQQVIASGQVHEAHLAVSQRTLLLGGHIYLSNAAFVQEMARYGSVVTVQAAFFNDSADLLVDFAAAALLGQLRLPRALSRTTLIALPESIGLVERGLAPGGTCRRPPRTLLAPRFTTSPPSPAR